MDDSDRIILQYLPLSEGLAVKLWKRLPMTFELDELKALAHLGLTQAAKRWPVYCDEKHGGIRDERFLTTYLTRRIHGEMVDSLRQLDWASREDRARLNLLIGAGLNEGVGEQELSEETGITIRDIRKTLQSVARYSVSLETPQFDRAGASLGDVLPSNMNIESNATADYLLSVVVDTVKTLSKEQQVILAMHYFLELDLQEVADRIGLHASKTSRLHTAAVMTVYAALSKAIKDD